MKLRLKGNTLRLRLNQTEVLQFASGAPLQETIFFPGNTSLSYLLSLGINTAVTFSANVIRIAAPSEAVCLWASGDEIGLYFDCPADPSPLKIAIEKDLECLDAPAGERDLDAFPRPVGKNC